VSVVEIINAAYAETENLALLRLLDQLCKAGYRFTCPTNATTAHNRRRRGEQPERDLRDVFGWSLDFARSDLPRPVFEAAASAGVLEQADGRWRSTVRVSQVAGRLFLHSAYPTDDPDAIFLGPDSYRFVRLIQAQALVAPPASSILDIGVGAAVGAVAAGLLHHPVRLVGTDVNPSALELARINARHAGLELEAVLADGPPETDELFDLIIANPPFVSGSSGRSYRDGGGQHGLEVSLAWVRQAMPRLTPGGRLLLYTGSAIVAGKDRFAETLLEMAAEAGWSADYEEIDPDIFGGMLREDDYAGVERVAAVAAVIRKPWPPAPRRRSARSSRSSGAAR
jgi:methylase of polypeptide subunit release factors